MSNKYLIRNVKDSLVPISRFNKGEANKIFSEVKESGSKIVVKNNEPVCVLVEPELYDQMRETVAEYRLLLETERRVKEADSRVSIPQDRVLSALGISEEDLDNIDVEIE